MGKAKRVLIRSVSLFLIAIIGGTAVFGFFGCNEKKYNVIYEGSKEWYKGAKDSYEAGETVTVYYYMIATDTDYSFFLDDERLNVGYDEGKGFVITFKMPEHDVTLKCEHRNSMEYIPEIEPGTMLIDYYEATVATVGGDGHYEMVLSAEESPDKARLDVYRQDDPEEEERCTSYIVPYEALDRCYDAIDDAGFRTWDELDDTVGLTGAVKVVKFREIYDDTYVRVSSEKMPEDGMASFERIRSIIREYIDDDYLMYQR